MAFAALVATAMVALAAFLYLSRKRMSSSPSSPLPPGPPRLPVIGNIYQAPKSHAWLQYEEWGKAYGPVVYLNMAGQSVIILSTFQAAHDLLNRQGANFADRPRFVVSSEHPLEEWHQQIVGLTYDFANKSSWRDGFARHAYVASSI